MSASSLRASCKANLIYYRDHLLYQVPMLTLNPAVRGVYRRYPEIPFNESSLGNPYPYGFDPVCAVQVILCCNS